MSLLEKELIGALLNAPDASGEAMGVLPEYFTDPVYSAIWAYMQEAKGQFSLATILYDTQHIEGAKTALTDAYTDCPSGFGTTHITAQKVIADYKRRQFQLITDYMWNDVNSGKAIDGTLAKYSPHMEALSKIGNLKSRFTGVSPANMEIPVTPWLIKKMMPIAGVGFMAGAPKAGKSFLSIHAAMSVSSGLGSVFGRRCNKIGTVYIAAEDYSGCQARVKAWEIRNPNAGDSVFELFSGPVDLLDPDCVMDLVRGINETAKRFAMKGERLGLVVVDTLARCLPGADENSAEPMSRAMRALETIGAMTGAFVLVVAHHGKSGASGGVRGWSGLDAASDMTLTVERDDDDPTLRKMTLSKIKNGVDGQVFAFRLDRVGLGTYDEEGEELDSAVCQFEALSAVREQKQRALPAYLTVVFDAVKYVTDNGITHTPPVGAHARVWSRAVDFSAVKAHAVKNGFWGEGVTGNDRFCKALEGLVAAKRIGLDTEEDRIWLI